MVVLGIDTYVDRWKAVGIIEVETPVINPLDKPSPFNPPLLPVSL